MIQIILFSPEIPQNTGNIGRLCAITGAKLHLIHPLGFKVTDRYLKRSGMDYWHDLDVTHHEDWAAFENGQNCPKRIWLLTTKSKKSYWNVKFEKGDGLLFGSEGAGCPRWLHEKIGENQRITIPHFQEGLRSLNLATSVGIVTYEALRQIMN